jgi:hypothetical protein
MIDLRPNRRLLVLALALASLVATAQPAAAKGHMSYHGGDVVASPTVYTIFWLPPGYHFDPQGDAGYENLVNQFLHDVSGTPYYNVLTQYSKDDQGQTVKSGPILDQVSFGGSYVDTTPFPHAGTQTDPLTRPDIAGAVTRAMAAQGWTPAISHLFSVYLPAGAQECSTGGGHLEAVAQGGVTLCTFSTSAHPEAECADRDWFETPAGTVYLSIQAVEGCAPLTGVTPDAVAAKAVERTDFNLVEYVTDPKAGGWYGSSIDGGEVADDCGFASHALSGHTYLLDALWDNTSDECVYAYPPPTASASLHARTVAPHAVQTLSVTTAPGAQVVTVVVYNDGTTKAYTGKTDARGKYRKSWRVPKIKGKVDLDIRVTTADGALGRLHRSFKIH